MVEIVQLLDNVFGLIKIDMMELSRKIAEFTQTAVKYLAGCATKVSTRVKATLQTEAQGMEDMLDDWSLTGLAAGVSTILAGLVVGVGASSFSDGWKVIKRFSDYGRSISNLERGARSAWTIAESIFNGMHKLFQNILGRKSLTEAQEQFSKSGIDITNYIDQINGFVDPMMSFDDKKRTCTLDYMKNLRCTANKVEGLLMHDIVRVSSIAKQIIVAKIKELRDFLKGNNFRAGDLERAIPFGVAFVGTPGCGKSLAANLLAHKLTEFGVVEGSPYKQGDIYFWMPIKKFMDNYEQQAIVMIDDMACTTDAAGTEAPEHKLLQMFSNGAYYPEMARLEDKGRAFVSEVIIASTNTAYPEYKSLRDGTALHRRRNLLFQQEKITEDGSRMENWRFKRMHPVRPGACHTGLMDHITYTFEEVVAIVVHHLELWRNSKTTNVSEVKINPKFMEALRNKENFPNNETLEERQKRMTGPIITEAQNRESEDSPDKPSALIMDGVHWIDIPLDDEVEEWDMEDAPEDLGGEDLELTMRAEWLNADLVAATQGLGYPMSIQVTRDYQGFLEQWYVDWNGNWRNFEDVSEFSDGLYTDDEEEAVIAFAVEAGAVANEIEGVTYDYWRAQLDFISRAYLEIVESRNLIYTDVQMMEMDSFCDEGDYGPESYNGVEIVFNGTEDSWYKTYDNGFKFLATKLEDIWYVKTKWITDIQWDWIEVICGILAGVVVITGVIKLTQLWRQSGKEMETEALNYDGRTALKEVVVHHPESMMYDQKNNLAKVNVVHEGLQYDQKQGLEKTLVTLPEGCANSNTRDMLQGRLRTNTYWLVIRGEGKTASSNAVMLRGTDLLFPKHNLIFWEGLSSNVELEFELIRDTNVMRESIPLNRIKISAKKDFASVRMSCGKVHSHKSLLEWIAPEESLGKRINGFDCATVSIDPEDNRKSVSYHYGRADMARAQVNKNGIYIQSVPICFGQSNCKGDQSPQINQPEYQNYTSAILLLFKALKLAYVWKFRYGLVRLAPLGARSVPRPSTWTTDSAVHALA
jgi:hypothetical protein